LLNDLLLNGYQETDGGHFKFENSRSHGVDIKARKGGRVIFIETKGESQNRSGNEVNFVYGLG